MLLVISIEEYKTRKSFTRIDNRLIKDKTLSATDKVVYMTLCTFMNNETKVCFPTYETLSEVSGFSRRTIIRSINNLCDKKYVEKVLRKENNTLKNQSNIYKIL